MRNVSTSGTIIDVFTEGLGVPSRTAQDYARRLRADPTIMRPTRAGRPSSDPSDALTTPEVTSWLIALCATPPATRKALGALETVKLVRAAERVLGEANEVGDLSGLSLSPSVSTFGAAIDALVDDMRSSAFAAWEGRNPARVWVKFFNGGARVVLGLERWPTSSPADRQLTYFVFRSNAHSGDKEAALLECVNTLDGLALRVLALALGPPPN